MSNGAAYVYTPDGKIIGYSIYHGTSDMQSPWMTKIQDQEVTWEMEEAFDTCHHTEEPCIIYNTYQDSWYTGTCCQKCMSIIDGTDPNGICRDVGYEKPDESVVPKELHEGRPFPDLDDA